MDNVKKTYETPEATVESLNDGDIVLASLEYIPWDDIDIEW